MSWNLNMLNKDFQQPGVYKKENICMTTKDRAYLKGLAMNIDPVLSLGKSSLTPEFVAAASEALEARELIKINVLKNCFDDPKELGITLAERTRSTLVQVIGRKVVLYRPNRENPKIVLPGDTKKKQSVKAGEVHGNLKRRK